MTIQRVPFLLIPALALAACGGEKEAVTQPEDMELAEDTGAESTVADEMASGQPEIREGGGRAVGGADNPNDPVVPTDAELAEQDPAEVR